MSPGPENLKSLIFPAITVTLACALLLALTHMLTRGKIADNRRAAMLQVINDILPDDYNNDLLHDVIEVRDPDYFAGEDPVSVYRLRKDGRPLGVILLPVIAKGYNGPIELALGVSYAGTLTGVRVRNQRETAGLGDNVHQDKSDWIRQFTGMSFSGTPREQWAVRRDGGEFDQLSGATITPRGVVKAVKNALDYYELNREKLYHQP